MTGDLIRREKFAHIHRETEGKYHVMTEAETRVMKLQAKECQGLLETTSVRS